MRRGAPGTTIESLAIAIPSAPDRFSLVLSVPASAPGAVPAAIELGGPDWTAEIELPEPGAAAAPDPSRPAAIDYTARDFTSLLTMLLNVIDCDFGEGLADQPVSQTAAVVEELAYLGDALSYGQDGVATEAYLASARRRISVCRHADLLDYPVGMGQSARAWVRFEVAEPITLPAHTQLLAGPVELPDLIAADQLPAAAAAGGIVFETLAPVSLEPDSPPYQLANPPHAEARLAAGATSATIQGAATALAVGQLVLIEPAERFATAAGQVVRLTAVTTSGDTTLLEWGKPDAVADDEALTAAAVQVRAGNLVLADQAQTFEWAELPPPQAGPRPYRPELPVLRPAFTAGPGPGGGTTVASAADLLGATGAAVLPAVALRAGPDGLRRDWVVRETLLDSGPFDPAFVVEVEDDGPARLRFGDGTNGMRPPVGAGFEVRVRAGGGSAGNVGIGSIAHVVGQHAPGLRVRNPVAAVGGGDPEPLARVRLTAPTAFRITDRAVTAPQYSAAARAVAGVREATTRIVPSGTGPLASVRVFAGDWTTPVAPLLRKVRDALDRRRPIGVALDVREAVAAPVTIEFEITIDPDWSLAAMATAVEQTLAGHLLGRGRFGFGTTLHRSQVITWLTPLDGVIDVRLRRFRFTEDPDGTPAGEQLAPAFGHIIRIDDDPAAPALGSVSFELAAAPS